MSTTTNNEQPGAAPHTLEERLELANLLFREFHTRCFWHSPRDLIIGAELIPFVAKGLRTHGGRRGFLLAGKLQPRGTSSQGPQRDQQECP